MYYVRKMTQGVYNSVVLYVRKMTGCVQHGVGTNGSYRIDGLLCNAKL